MLKKPIHIPLEILFSIFLVVLGLLLRTSRLEWPPPNEQEAAYALTAAASVDQGSAFWPLEGAQPIEHSLAHLTSGFLFSILGSSLTAARLLSVIAGTAIIILPLLFRDTLGRGVASISAFLIAVSPILLKTSRVVGGPAAAVLSLTFFMLMLIRRSLGRNSREDPTMVGVALGLALMSGPSAYQGVFGILLGMLILGGLRRWSIGSGSGSMDNLPLRSVLPALGITILLLGTGFGLAPENLRGVFDGLSSWISGWRLNGLSALTLFLILLVYEPLVLLFGLLRKPDLSGKVREFEPWMLSWAFGALIAALAYPNHQPENIVWLVVPLIFLTAGAVRDTLDRAGTGGISGLSVIFSGGLLTLFAFSYLQLSNYASVIAGVAAGFDPMTRLGASLSGVGLALIGLVLIAFGWTWQLAWNSLRLAGLVFMLGLAVSAGWNLNFGESATGARELWNPAGTTPVSRILQASVENLSEAATGRDDALRVDVLGDPAPVVAWTLRAFPAPINALPDVFLLPEAEVQPSLPVEYRGQILTLGETWAWSGVLPPDPLIWWVRRELPVAPENWILFARQGLAGLENLQPLIDE